MPNLQEVTAGINVAVDLGTQTSNWNSYNSINDRISDQDPESIKKRDHKLSALASDSDFIPSRLLSTEPLTHRDNDKVDPRSFDRSEARSVRFLNFTLEESD